MKFFRTDSEELKKEFLALTTARNLAALFGISYAKLCYHIYKLPNSKKYATFSIPKKSGGYREINAPISSIKIIQENLNFVLQKIYQPKACVHGFILNKNIVSNARSHLRKHYVLNIDLDEFFPSLNFGRVRGLFMAFPFNFNRTVATILAQISCFDGHLPQGAPSSPIISNFICARLDSELLALAIKHRCKYTRYADDLTFSTSANKFPRDILKPDNSRDSEIKIGDKLLNIIFENGFKINSYKTRMRSNLQRQVVTGLTVNEFPNVTRKLIRQVRAMLHAWEKYGVEKAESEHLDRFDQKIRNANNKVKTCFEDVVIGKINFIGMVRGKHDGIYKKFCNKLVVLDPTAKLKIELDKKEARPLIVTEGESDWKHLKSALRYFKKEKFFSQLNIEFSEYHGDMGDSELLKMCIEKMREPQDRIYIFIFDNDKPDIIRKVNWNNSPKIWGNKVYSFSIPSPSHRTAPNVDIELYYKDDEIKTKDASGRRLYLNTEFVQQSSKHSNENCACKNSGKLRCGRLCVVDSASSVIDSQGNNIALSKNNFAKNILYEVDGFQNFDFSEFKQIFEIIEKIIHKELLWKK